MTRSSSLRLLPILLAPLPLLAAPASAHPPAGLLDLVAGLGLAPGDLAVFDPLSVGPPPDPFRAGRAGSVHGSPLPLRDWVEQRADRLSRDLPPAGGLPSWDGFFDLALEGMQAPAARGDDECMDGARAERSLVDHVLLLRQEQGRPASRREARDLREGVGAALDARIGRLVDDALLARCRLDLALRALDEADRARVVEAAAALLAGLVPGTAAAETEATALAGAWSDVDGPALIAAGAAWSLAVGDAAADLAAMPAEEWPEQPSIFEVAQGEVWIGSAGHNSGTGDPFLLLDPGGDDAWRIEPGRTAFPEQGTRPVRGWIDLGGDDLWQGGASGVGAALLSLAAGVDVGGDDTWRTGGLAGAAAVFGVATWLDTGGADLREGGIGVQGFAAFGAAALRDRGTEDDVYVALDLAQGAALPQGTALLHDEAGDDRFSLAGRRIAGPAGDLWPLRGGQGLGLGLHPLAGGGLGWLQDEIGDDIAVGAAQVQGACSSRGVGVLVDRAGDDARRVGDRRGQAAAGTACTAALVDADGDDDYLGGAAVQASAEDRSLALLLDGRGDDRYLATGPGQAVAGEGAVALLLDEGGADMLSTQAACAALGADAGQAGQPWSDPSLPGLGKLDAGVDMGLPGLALLVDAGGAVWRAASPGAVPPQPVPGPAPAPPASAAEVAALLDLAAAGQADPGLAADVLARAGLPRLRDAIAHVAWSRPAEAAVVDLALRRAAAGGDQAGALASALAEDALSRSRSAEDDATGLHLAHLATLVLSDPAAAAQHAIEAAGTLLDHPAARVRAHALRAHAAIARTPGVEVDPLDLDQWQGRAVVALRGDPDPQVRAAALDLLEAAGGPGAAGPLGEFLQRSDARLADMAEAALLAINARSDGVAVARSVFPIAAGEAGAPASARQAALRLLGATRHKDAWEVLEPALADPDPRVRLAAVEGARRLGGRAVERALLGRLAGETDPRVLEALRGGGEAL